MRKNEQILQKKNVKVQKLPRRDFLLLSPSRNICITSPIVTY